MNLLSNEYHSLYFSQAVIEALLPLRLRIADQLGERRSAVSRQACHLIEALAEAIGPEFEPFTLKLLPPLLKATNISINVVAEAADACCRCLVRHCPSGKALTLIAEVTCKDKAARVRQRCASYLQLMLELWRPAIWSSQTHLAAVEKAIALAAQDATAEARNAGRGAFAAYHAALPSKAEAFVQAQSHHVAVKLQRSLPSP